jgi:cytochrome c peroxidase
MNKLNGFIGLAAVISMLSNCKESGPGEVVSNPDAVLDETPYELSIGTFSDPNFNGNELTVEGVRLGRMLFYDKQMSLDNSISCGSCHKQDNGFSDPDRLSEGVGGSLGKRQAMAIFNTAWHTNEFFWDGRSHLLRDQSLKPIEDGLEMKETLANVISKLKGEQLYLDQFTRAFGDDDITSERMSLALEQFMNSIVSNQSKYDDHLAGSATLTDSEERGRVLFFAEYNPSFPEVSGADCAHCHGGNNFDNNRYMNNGLDIESEQTDIGREDVSLDPADKAKFKVPSLRNVELTAPYMHDGRFTSLEEVVNHYNENIHISPTIDPALEYTTQTGLMLSDQDQNDLIAFLKTLTDETLATDDRYSDPYDN